MKRFVNKCDLFRKRQDGNATIEFVVLFPAFMTLFLTGFEAGFYMVKNVMLERAVDIAVRDVRLGNGKVPAFAALKKRICDEAVIIPDCMKSIKVDLQPVPSTPGGVMAVTNGNVKCLDSGLPPNIQPGSTFDPGEQNKMMLIRVCAMSEPLFPTTGIGVGMKSDSNGNMAIVSTTAFVNEPGNRGGAGGGTGGNGNGNGNGNGGGI